MIKADKGNSTVLNKTMWSTCSNASTGDVRKDYDKRKNPTRKAEMELEEKLLQVRK